MTRSELASAIVAEWVRQGHCSAEHQRTDDEIIGEWNLVNHTVVDPPDHDQIIAKCADLDAYIEAMQPYYEQPQREKELENLELAFSIGDDVRKKLELIAARQAKNPGWGTKRYSPEEIASIQNTLAALEEGLARLKADPDKLNLRQLELLSRFADQLCSFAF